MIHSRGANRVDIITKLDESNAPGQTPTGTRGAPSFLHFSHGDSLVSDFFEGFFHRYGRPDQFKFCHVTTSRIRGLLNIVGRLLGSPRTGGSVVG